jgi:hypothetical protein
LIYHLKEGQAQKSGVQGRCRRLRRGQKLEEVCRFGKGRVNLLGPTQLYPGSSMRVLVLTY